MPLLEARQIGHSYLRFPARRIVSLHDVELLVEPGQCWGLVGPNGSGKSTLLRIAAGLAEPHSGSVRVNGQRASSRAAHRVTGYAPESVRWPRALTVADALHELAALHALGGAVQRVQKVVQLTGLGDVVFRRLGTLSLGQARRVVLAQALLDDPLLLLLDEPFSGLDSLVILDLREHLRARLAQGAGIVLASHRLEDLTGLCTHVLVLRAGRVADSGPAADVLAGSGERPGLAALLGGRALMGGVLIMAASTVRRMLRPAAILLAALAGVLAGLAVRGLPGPSLAPDVYAALVRVLAAILVLPLAAGVQTAERRGGFEQLVAVRPLSSLAWTLGRTLGAVLSVAGLVLLLASCARWVGGSTQVPERLAGQRMDTDGAAPTWRFPLPAGTRGPFDLQLQVLSHPRGTAQLVVDISRGDAVQSLVRRVAPRSGLTLSLPDLWPQRGDLFVTLRPEPGLLLARATPQLVTGSVPLGRHGLPLPTGAVAGLLLALLMSLAAASAFHFETACLAGLLALAVELPAAPWSYPLAVLLLLVVAMLGTALQRRSALP